MSEEIPGWCAPGGDVTGFSDMDHSAPVSLLLEFARMPSAQDLERQQAAARRAADRCELEGLLIWHSGYAYVYIHAICESARASWCW